VLFRSLTTAQGIVGLEVLVNRKQNISSSAAEGTPNVIALKRGLAWLRKHQEIEAIPEWYWGDEPLFEYLSALSDASATAGEMNLKQPTKIKTISNFLLEKQELDGSWEGKPLAENHIAATARAVIALCNVRKDAPNIPKKIKATPTQTNDSATRGIDSGPGLKMARLVGADGDGKYTKLIPKLSQSLQAAYSTEIHEVTVSHGNKIPTSVSMAWLTCKNHGDLLRIQTRSTRNYLNSGGILLVDSSATGRSMFWDARRVLSRVFNGGVLVKLTDDDPLINGDFGGGIGNNISRVTYTSVGDLGIEKVRADPGLWGLKFNGRIVAIITKNSLSGAIAGETTSSYTSQAAQRIVLNALLYANSLKPPEPER